MLMRPRRRKRLKITRHLCHATIPPLLLLDYPMHLWDSLKKRSYDLGVSLDEFLQREAKINQVIDMQLASLDPEIAVQGGGTSKPGPERIERIFSHLKR